MVVLPQVKTFVHRWVKTFFTAKILRNTNFRRNKILQLFSASLEEEKTKVKKETPPQKINLQKIKRTNGVLYNYL